VSTENVELTRRCERGVEDYLKAWREWLTPWERYRIAPTASER
jgi:hypothetical protein